MMQTIEERVAYLEGKVEEQSKGTGEISTRIEGLSFRIDGLDHKVDRFRDELSGRIDALDHRFVWLIGIQITTLLAMIGLFLRPPL